ncbi:hypothetical protein AUJ17_04970 [Candidatus Micrarchaeota archaeon CG1_02_47_40]|nr:MAG: hypothetical protein AUJ17_04970 [Candidatus Micrarchaeota archaeon CG1_02_47_40]
MKWGIIGAGLIGKKRALALSELGEEILLVSDLDLAKADSLAKECNARSSSNWKEVARSREIDAVIVATTHDFLSKITVESLKHGKHVLVEKPAGRTPSEVKKIIRAQEKSGHKVCVGFNHRFHPAVLEAKKICDLAPFGHLLYMRARYGHGGRPGYEKEWRFNPQVSGGGQLIDQGSHLIDLSSFFAGKPMSLSYSLCKNYFWKAQAEDTSVLVLESDKGNSAVLQTSCTQWKNLFSFEIFFERAQLNIDGLGGSYGTETLTIYKMKPEMGPPDTEIKKFEGADTSFKSEISDFISLINGKPSICANAGDALASISIISRAYKKTAKGKSAPGS